MQKKKELSKNEIEARIEFLEKEIPKFKSIIEQGESAVKKAGFDVPKVMVDATMFYMDVMTRKIKSCEGSISRFRNLLRNPRS